MLEVPDSMNCNAKSVRDLGQPEETGRMLIDYMCKRIGIDNLSGLDILDFGCGVRFSQSILNLKLPIGTYFGLDVNKEIIDFLTENVNDARFTYKQNDVANQLYHKNGPTPDDSQILPLSTEEFDIACMFSVITHQNPVEAVPTFKLLRRHIRATGHMFFSAFIHDDDGASFKELVRERPGLKCSYTQSSLTALLADCGWEVVSYVDAIPDNLPIMSSFLCRPLGRG
jgi:SAM-dependent methyltransferase